MTNETATVDSLTGTIHNGVNQIVTADKPFEKLDKAKELHSYISNESADFEETKGLLEFMVNLNKYINFMTFANSVYSSLKADSRAMYRLETIQQSYLLTDQDVPLSEESEMLMDDSQRMINRFRDNSVFENNKPIASTILTFLERKGDLSLKPMGKYLAYQLKDKMAEIAPVPKVERVKNDDGEWEYPSLTDEQKEGLKKNSELLKELKDLLYKQISDVVRKMTSKGKTYSSEERKKARELFKDGFYGLARELKIDNGLSDEKDTDKKARQKELYDKIREEIESAFSTFETEFLKQQDPKELERIQSVGTERRFANLPDSTLAMKYREAREEIKYRLFPQAKKARSENNKKELGELIEKIKDLEYLMQEIRDEMTFRRHAEFDKDKKGPSDRSSNITSVGSEMIPDSEKVQGAWSRKDLEYLEKEGVPPEMLSPWRNYIRGLEDPKSPEKNPYLNKIIRRVTGKKNESLASSILNFLDNV